MPFTLAHPAAVLPLPRVMGRWCVFSALVVGSMAPDFAYFAPLGVSGEQTHSLAGLLWFCIPAGLTALLVFHGLLKQPLISLFPEWMQASLAPYTDSRSPRGGWRWLPIVICLAIGALTHIVWDAFTHRGAPAVEMLPVLNATVTSAGGYELRVYKILQHGSTLLGMAAVALCAWGWLRRNPGTPSTLPVRWSTRQRAFISLALVLLPCTIGSAIAFERVGWPDDFDSLRSLAGAAVTSGMGALALVLVAFGAMATWIERAHAARESAR